MAESECGRGKFVHDGRITFLVVTVVEAVCLEGQLVQVDGVPAQHAGKKLVPRQVLKEQTKNLQSTKKLFEAISRIISC